MVEALTAVATVMIDPSLPRVLAVGTSDGRRPRAQIAPGRVVRRLIRRRRGVRALARPCHGSRHGSMGHGLAGRDLIYRNKLRDCDRASVRVRRRDGLRDHPGGTGYGRALGVLGLYCRYCTGGHVMTVRWRVECRMSEGYRYVLLVTAAFAQRGALGIASPLIVIFDWRWDEECCLFYCRFSAQSSDSVAALRAISVGERFGRRTYGMELPVQRR
ncbi:hypothetical protein THAOC_07475 [Thalassiosira oceanica]|uniref:Uncharacterized protein n=1 Tax=Thalassiosira oceanica TaxID=159749 RepID=K0TCD1_THAOC|nr:hypothetical protein THAOC_07475 [Thalassiosira oceanica]|eukprot:EJK71116.1 hypothetical protein THAOC_07475 [Thalassiosira oceanica]